MTSSTACKRTWHGWTTPSNADRYERLLVDDILVESAARRMPGWPA